MVVVSAGGEAHPKKMLGSPASGWEQFSDGIAQCRTSHRLAHRMNAQAQCRSREPEPLEQLAGPNVI